MRKKIVTKKEPWMLIEEYGIVPPVNPLCAGCLKNCKQRFAYELECDFYSPEESGKVRMSDSV